MKTFSVYLKNRDNPIVVQGDKAEDTAGAASQNLSELGLTIKDSQGNDVAHFWPAELQGWHESVGENAAK